MNRGLPNAAAHFLTTEGAAGSLWDDSIWTISWSTHSSPPYIVAALDMVFQTIIYSREGESLAKFKQKDRIWRVSLFSKTSSSVVNSDVVGTSVAGGGISDSISTTHLSTAQCLATVPRVCQLYSTLLEVTEGGVSLSVYSTYLGVLRVTTILLRNWR